MVAKQMKRPIITIVTPSYNQGKYIERTIKSVLAQKITDLEYLIFDGGSTDNTVDILRSFEDSIQWISERDSGQADAVNRGFKKARGEIIGWLNSDDIYYTNTLHDVIDLFNSNSDIDIVYGMADHIDEQDNFIETYYAREWSYEQLKSVCYICQPAVFFRRSVIDEFGLLNDKLRYCMDYEFWLRIGKHKSFYYLQKKLAGSRLYPETKTLGSRVAVHKEILSMLKQQCDYTPSRWIYNYAHAVLDESGLKRESPEENLHYVRKLIWICIISFFKYRYYVPMTDAKLMASWYFGARKGLGGKRSGENRV